MHVRYAFVCNKNAHIGIVEGSIFLALRVLHLQCELCSVLYLCSALFISYRHLCSRVAGESADHDIQKVCRGRRV